MNQYIEVIIECSLILIGFYITFILHEVGHALFACLFHFHIISIVLGNKYDSLKFGKIYFSFVPKMYYVECDVPDVKSIKTFLFFFGGILTNMLMIVMILLFPLACDRKQWLLLINIICIIVSLLPNKKNSDISGYLLLGRNEC